MACKRMGMDRGRWIYFQVLDNRQNPAIYVCVATGVAEYLVITAFRLAPKGDKKIFPKSFQNKEMRLLLLHQFNRPT